MILDKQRRVEALETFLEEVRDSQARLDMWEAYWTKKQLKGNKEAEMNLGATQKKLKENTELLEFLENYIENL